jgi:predicted MFS family arabinose efflux permease
MAFFKSQDFIDARARLEFILFGLATFLIFFMNAQAALLSTAFKQNNVPLSEIGLLLSLYGVPVVIVTLFTGKIATWLGSLGSAQWGTAIMALGFMSLAVTAHDFWLAMISRLTWGIGYGLMFSPLFTYAQSRITGQRFVYLLGLFSSMAPLAQAAGPPFAEFILAYAGAQWMFILGAIPAWIGVGLLALMRPLKKPPAAQGLALGQAFTPSRHIPMTAIFVAGAMFGFLAAYMAPFLHQKNISIAWYFVSMTVGIFSTRFIGLGFFQKLEPRLVVAGGMFVMALAYILLVIVMHPFAVAACGMLFGSGYSVVYPVLSAWVSEGLSASERAGPQALFNAIFNAGLLWMPLPITGIVALFDYAGALQALAGLSIGMGLFLVWRTQRRRPSTR